MDTWEIDPNALTLDEYLILKRGPGADPEATKRVLDKLVTNKTAEELGQDYTWAEILAHLRRANKLIEDMAVPKGTDTP